MRRVRSPALVLALCLGSAALAAPLEYVFQTPDLTPLTSGPVTARVEQSVIGPEAGNSWTRIFLSHEGGFPTTVAIDFRGEGSVRRVVTLVPGEQRSLVIPLPPPIGSGRLLLQAAGEDLAVTHFYAGRGGEVQVVAVSPEEVFTKAVGYAPIPIKELSSRSPEMRVISLSAKQLPLELSAYAGVDAIYLGETTLEALDEGRRRVLEAYAATGGRLALGRCTAASRGYLPLLESTSGQETSREYGFGALWMCNGTPASLAAFVATRTMAPAIPRKGTQKHGEAITDLLLPDAVPPVGSFFLIMLAFGVAVGPGSYWVVRRRGPGALLATLPGSAAVTSILIIGSAFIGNGLGIKASTRGLTWLDSRHGRAVTVGMGAFFAGSAPSDLPVANDASWSFQEASVSLEPGYVLRRGFIPPRTYVEWAMASVAPARERIVLREVEGRVLVQNALGAKLRSIHVRHRGKLWMASAIPEGGEAAVQVTQRVPEPEGSSPITPAFMKRMRGPLAEGEFLALAEGPGLLPLAGLKLEHVGSEHLFRGEVQR